MKPLQAALMALCALALLWGVWVLYAAGRPVWAAAFLATGSMLWWVYASSRTMAWRYLLPGVAGMLIFVALPLLYTVHIGFTNYSSSHLLEQSRARAYLLEQFEVEPASVMRAQWVREAAPSAAVRLRLWPEEAQAPAATWISPPLNLQPGVAWSGPPVLVQPEAAAEAQATRQVLSLRETIALRDAVRPLRVRFSDGRELSYTGVNEFAVAQPVWLPQEDGAIMQRASQVLYRPNLDTGFFESAQGDRMLPGFKVGIGWDNYRRLLTDANIRGPFVSIFVWTVVFAGLTVVLATALGMSLAVVLNWEALKYRHVYRTLLFLPYAVPGFISILVFKGLFNQNFGEINALLDAVFGVRPAWFADPLLAKVMILIVNTWLGYPYIMVLCTGLIKAIPADLYEASAIAGASPWQNFWRITAPLIMKPLTPLLISAFAFNFNNFVLISLLTDGRPDFLNTQLPAGTTDILVSYTYRIAFTDSGQNFGLAAAISTIIFLMIALMSLAQLKLMPKSQPKP